MRACKITQIKMMRGQYHIWILFQLKSSLPFSLFLFVWRIGSTTTKSSPLQWISTVWKPSTETLSEMEGQHGRIRRFAVGPVHPNKSLTMCSSADFVFRKYRQGSAFRVSGVLQLAKTGPPVMKNFPLLRIFPSDEWWLEGFTHVMTSTVLICIFWPPMECRTFWLKLANFEAREKIHTSSPKPKLENYESQYHKLQ